MNNMLINDERNSYVELQGSTLHPLDPPNNNAGRQEKEESGDSYSKANQGLLYGCGNFMKCLVSPFFFCGCGCGSSFVVPQGTVGVILNLGKYERTLPPGTYIRNPCTETIRLVDMRVQVRIVQAQSILTSDSVSLHLSTVVYFQIKDAYLGIFGVDNYTTAIVNLVLGSIRNIFGETRLQQLLDNRKVVDEKICEMVNHKSQKFGIRTYNIEINQITLPLDMQKAMATVAESLKAKEANINIAEGQRLAASQRRQAADVMVQSKDSLILEYFNTLKKLAVSQNSTLFIPSSYFQKIDKSISLKE